MTIDIILIGVGLILVLGALMLSLKKKARISEKKYNEFISHLEGTKNLDPAHAVLKCHSHFIEILRSMARNKRQTAAKLTAQFEKRFPNKEKIWSFHRLRNRIAHQGNVTITPTQATEARVAYVRALKGFVR